MRLDGAAPDLRVVALGAFNPLPHRERHLPR